MAGRLTTYLRRQAYEVWPRLGRLARLTVYFAGVEIILVLLWRLAALARRGQTLLGWVEFVGFLTGLLALLLVGGWLRRKVMWRLRNRLVVTYVFIGVIPVVLLALIWMLSAYLFAWQFAVFIATSDIRAEVGRLSALNRRTALELSDRLSRGEPLNAETLRSAAGREPVYADREITAWFRGKAVTIKSGAETPMPPNASPQMHGLMLDGNRMVLRAADTERAGNSAVTVIGTVPVDEKLLGNIGSGLGEISLSLFSPTTSAKQGGTRITIGSESLELGADASPDNAGTVHAGTLPPPASRFDRMITGGSILTLTDWRTGGSHSALLGVLTRPSLLYATLFRTVGQSTTFLVVVLAVAAVFFALIELLALLIGVRLTRTMTRSVAELYSATEHVNRGDLHYRIDIRRDDQMGELERSFNSMTASLERLLAEQKEKQRLENELAIAQEVQSQLFPKRTTEIPALELYGVCRPARTVSGDYYDFLPLENGHVVLAAGDVSGKGISAALLMATIHSAVRAYCLETAMMPTVVGAAAGGHGGMSSAYTNGDLSPSKLMALLNRQLYQSTPLEKYATLFFSTYSSGSRVLSYCNAGHLPPVVLATDGELRRLDQGGTVVGLFDSTNYDEARVKLAPGEIFLAYSDGLTEPENDFGEFGETRLIEVIRDNRHLPLERISELAMNAVLDWIGGNEQPDDMTLVLARPR